MIKIKKDQFDKLMDGLENIIISEIEKVKSDIDINEDGYVNFYEFKVTVKAIIKALKKAIKGIK